MYLGKQAWSKWSLQTIVSAKVSQDGPEKSFSRKGQAGPREVIASAPDTANHQDDRPYLVLVEGGYFDLSCKVLLFWSI